MLETLRKLARPVLASPAGVPIARRLDSLTAEAQGLRAFDRPQWLWARGKIPQCPRHEAPLQPASDAQLALCERLIGAYRAAHDSSPELKGMWMTDLFQHRHRDLLTALDARDAAALATQLAGMFRSDFVLGMAGGSLGLRKMSRLSTRLECLATLSKLVALAESVGAAQLECPEQASVGIALRGGVERLAEQIEASIGMSIAFPEVGAPYGVMAGGRLLTADTPEQIYAATRICAAIRTHLPDVPTPLSLVEIGGGYGGMAYWCSRMMPLKYAIVDLPVVNVLQGYFLSEALGHGEVSLHGEPTGRVSIVPTHALDDIATPVDVVVNKDSMPEIAEAAVIDYLTWTRANCSGIFYSYNQEAAVEFEGSTQNVVPELVGRLGGFTRLQRELSPLRRGYAEEAYRVELSTQTQAVG